jgi:hypothetical protein
MSDGNDLAVVEYGEGLLVAEMDSTGWAGCKF